MTRLLLLLGVGFLASANAPTQELSDKARLRQDYTAALELRNKGDLLGATVPLEKAVTQATRILNPSVAATMANELGKLYLELNLFEKAEKHCREAIRLTQLAHGDDHPRLCACLDNLATINYYTGRYAEVEPLYQRSLRIRLRYFSEAHADIAESCLALARYHQAMGQYDQALPLLERALKIRETRSGEKRPATADVLNALGRLHHLRGKPDEAEKMFRRCLDIREGAFGIGEEFIYLPHLQTAQANLALLLRDKGYLDRAKELLGHSLQTMESKLGKDHPDVAIRLDDLARLHLARGEVREAQEINNRCLLLWRNWVNTHYIAIAHASRTRAMIDIAQGKPQNAAVPIDNYSRRLRMYVHRVLPVLADTEQLDFLRTTQQDSLHFALSLGLNHKDDAALVRQSAEWLLNGKAIAHQALVERQQLAAASSDEKTRDLVNQLYATRSRLASLSTRIEADKADERRKELASLSEREQELSRKLGQAIGKPLHGDSWIKLDSVREELADSTVLIEIARFRLYAVKEKGKAPEAGEYRYAAWVIPPAKQGDVQVFDLGPADALEADVRTMRQKMHDGGRDIFDLKPDKAEAAIREPLSAVARRVLTPLEPVLSKANHWLISPDAALWLVPWAALPLKDGSYAIEKHRLRYHTSGRDLLANRPPRASGPSLVLADPDYDGEPGKRSDDIAPHRSLDTPRSLFRRLPGTAREAKELTPALKVYLDKEPMVLTEAKATKAAFKAIKQPRVLVLCTHGFFHPDQPDRRENPLLRCGLALHAANRREKGAEGDGILTGLEIVGTDLRGTDMVVLSACDTGVGEVLNGEGVAGLRQAFQLAGARSVFSSLWKVSDEWTVPLMKKFWDNLASGQNRVEALRNAQLDLIRDLRKKNGTAHPYLWAAFTQTGS